MTFTHSNPTKPIPFIANKSRLALENNSDYKRPTLESIYVKAKTRRFILIVIEVNSTKQNKGSRCTTRMKAYPGQTKARRGK